MDQELAYNIVLNMFIYGVLTGFVWWLFLLPFGKGRKH